MDDKWFKAQQKRAGVTAEDIARIAGRTRSNVSHILNGHQPMSMHWAKAFSEALGQPIEVILEKAGTFTPQEARTFSAGFSESDAEPWQAANGQGEKIELLKRAFGVNRNGVYLWRVKNSAMVLGGLLEGDFMVVDTLQAERVRAGDTVIAQVYNNSRGTATTVLRRFEPPVLLALSPSSSDVHVQVVDGVNVVIMGKVIASWRELGRT